MPTQVLVADDHQIVRQGLKALLEREGFKVVAEADNGPKSFTPKSPSSIFPCRC
jgi:DNA-binding NarL/FixJ family response regulator